MAASSALDPPRAARAAGLRYVNADEPGLRRVKAGRGFRYERADGSPVKDGATLARIRALAIPPAWTDVWICADGDGHVQAWGRDARGRRQYRYHAKWRAARDETKYARVLAFAEALPRIRARVDADLRRPGLPKEKVVATVVRLLERTHARVGNEEYARSNGSHGLTTLRDRHVRVRGGTARFRFRGKSGKAHAFDVEDAELARIVRRCQALPGQVLFQYEDDAGEARSVGSSDVNAYLRDASGEDFTAKDFRTWAGTVLAALALEDLRKAQTPTAARRNVVRAIERVAERLGNTPAVCRKCYVHPEVVASYLDGRLFDDLGRRRRVAAARGLDADEAAVLRLLRRRFAVARPARRARKRPYPCARRAAP